MAFFGVTREIIDEVLPHPNADKLEIGKLKDVNFRFVIPKGKYKPNDPVLYFPIDSVLPRRTAEAIGLYGKLSGKNKDRIKSLRLRGEISQGVVAPISILPDTNETNTEKITQVLGVTKYEPPVVPCNAGNLIALPVGLSAYDIEGAERNMDVLEQLMDIPVVVTEKLEGMNFGITRDLNGKIYVNQRNYSIEPIEDKEHDFWRVAKEKGLIELVEKIAWDYWPDSNVTLYGEFLGPAVQGNIYKLQEHTVKLFDIKVNDSYIDAIDFMELINIDQRVPTVFSGGTLREFLKDYDDIVHASHGVSNLNSGTFREGIVIKPEHEFRIDGYGRAIVKQRDAIYLSQSKL